MRQYKCDICKKDFQTLEKLYEDCMVRVSVRRKVAGSKGNFLMSQIAKDICDNCLDIVCKEFENTLKNFK